MRHLTTISLLLLTLTISAQDLSKAEMKMYRHMNYRRLLHGLRWLPLNEKLNTTAKLHLQNLADSMPDHKKEQLSGHSWFADPENRWKEDVFEKSGNKSSGLYKAKEITGYSSLAAEVLYGDGNGKVEPVQAVNAWMDSKGHRAEMLEQNDWSNSKWTNCGVAIINGYASIFFGGGK